MNILSLSSLLTLVPLVYGNLEQEEGLGSTRNTIEGKVIVPFSNEQDWIASTRILVDGGEYLGFLKSDGSFTVSNVPSGSYVVEVNNIDYMFEAIRVDINSKGKHRARRVNHIQPTAVNAVTYPLKFKARGKTNYFFPREQWRITDFLFSPMVLMMVMPFLMIMVLPKLINTADPETQKDLQNQMNIFNTKQNMPDLSELVTNWLGGGQAKKAAKAKVAKKPRT